MPDTIGVRTETGFSTLSSPKSTQAAGVHRTYLVYLGTLAIIALIEWGPLILKTLFFKHLHADLPLASPNIRFNDWTNFLPRVSHFGEPGMLERRDLGYPFPYPLPTFFVFLAFVKLTSHPTGAYVLVGTMSFVVATACFLFHLIRTHAPGWAKTAVLGTFVLSFPAMFLIDRGNVEVFLWVFVTLGLYTFVKRQHSASAISFAIAGSMKMYPALFLLLFLTRRKYRAFTLGVLTTIAVSLLAAQAIGPSIPQAMQDMKWSAEYLRDAQIAVVNEPSLAADHSLFALFKQTDYAIQRVFLHASGAGIDFYHWTTPYGIFAIAAFALTYFLRIRRLPLLNQFVAICIFSVLLPYVSYIYTLVHIYLVFAVLLLYFVEDRPVLSGRWPVFAALCLAITLSAINYLVLFRFRGQIQCLALLGLLAVVLAYPMPSTVFGDQELGSIRVPESA